MEIPLSKPCFFSGATPTGQGYTFVFGQREGGIRIFDVSANGTSEISTHQQYHISGIQSQCGLFESRSASDGSGFTDTQYRHLPELISFNDTTNSVEHYTQHPVTSPNPINLTYALSSMEGVLLDAANTLSLVKAVTLRNPYGYPSLGLLFTDGRHEGQHRLVIVGIDAARRIVQSTYSWEIGVPSDLVQLDITDAFGLEFVVFSRTSSQAIVFESATGNGVPLSLNGPYFIEVGLGASTAGYVPYDWGVGSGISILYPDKREAKIFAPLPN